jgi:hypothetical protein
MGFATHLGPWLLGTVKDTTGNTAGTIRNTGATMVTQSKAVLATDITANTTLAVLPAGAIIDNMKYITSTAYVTTTPTFAFFVNGTAITATLNASTFGNTGAQSFANQLGSVNPGLILNVGTTDAVVSFTQANVTGSTGAGTLVITYVVRAPDGAQFPASA